MRFRGELAGAPYWDQAGGRRFWMWDEGPFEAAEECGLAVGDLEGLDDQMAHRFRWEGMLMGCDDGSADREAVVHGTEEAPHGAAP